MIFPYLVKKCTKICLLRQKSIYFSKSKYNKKITHILKNLRNENNPYPSIKTHPFFGLKLTTVRMGQNYWQEKVSLTIFFSEKKLFFHSLRKEPVWIFFWILCFFFSKIKQKIFLLDFIKRSLKNTHFLSNKIFRVKCRKKSTLIKKHKTDIYKSCSRSKLVWRNFTIRLRITSSWGSSIRVLPCRSIR